MARVTVEDCLDKVPNRFAPVVLAAERARQLAAGTNPLVRCDNKPAVTSLGERSRAWLGGAHRGGCGPFEGPAFVCQNTTGTSSWKMW